MRPSVRWLLALLVLLGASQASAQLGLSPNHFDLAADAARRTQSFRVTNFGADAVQVRTEVVPFDIDENGEVVEIAPHDRSLERHLAISPVTFEIPAGASQVVRFSFRPVQGLAAGEYRSMVYFRLGGSASLSGKLRLPVSYRLGGAVYVQVGEPVRSAELTAVELDDAATAHFNLQSTGSANARMSGRYLIWTAAAWGDGRELPPLPQARQPVPDGLLMNGALPGRPALPGKRVRLAAPLREDRQPLAPGAYVLQMVGTIEGLNIDRVIPFRVAARPQ
jgi:hypothetical protein